MEGMEKKRVLWVGDGVTPTGFSRVNHGILKFLPEEEYDIHHMAVNYYGDPHDYPYKIYPASKPENLQMGDMMGFGRIKTLTGELKPDLIFILNDIWVIDEYLNQLKSLAASMKKNKLSFEMPKIVVYFPVDGEGYNSQWFTHFDIVDKVVVYTEFGKRVVQQAAPHIVPEVIPHGTDSETFYKAYESRKEAKELIKKDSKTYKTDSFIVLNANRNQPRKRIDIALEGFAIFAKDKPTNVMYYHHAGTKDAGWDIHQLANSLSLQYGFDVTSRLVLSNLNHGVQRVSDERLNLIYNATDVGITTSTGEGWGLTAVEHAVTGAPQVVSNHTAQSELFKDCGMLVDPLLRTRDDSTLLVRHFVSPEGVAEALEKLYSDKELYAQLSEAGVKKFTSEEYSWKYISTRWDKIFKNLL